MAIVMTLNMAYGCPDCLVNVNVSVFHCSFLLKSLSSVAEHPAGSDSRLVHSGLSSPQSPVQPGLTAPRSLTQSPSTTDSRVANIAFAPSKCDVKDNIRAEEAFGFGNGLPGQTTHLDVYGGRVHFRPPNAPMTTSPAWHATDPTTAAQAPLQGYTQAIATHGALRQQLRNNNDPDAADRQQLFAKSVEPERYQPLHLGPPKQPLHVSKQQLALSPTHDYQQNYPDNLASYASSGPTYTSSVNPSLCRHHGDQTNSGEANEASSLPVTVFTI